MESERLANFCEAQLAMKLEGFVDAEVTRFTSSIQVGRRYIGFKSNDGKVFAIEINVEEMKEA